ncbi:DUF1080 domain-containing protein [Pelagicoccus sp. SDUM812005]|uniref:3-keto-disaccharide hydrolase n=1 Tax=Pelagicoccus sp. SDUM812005 TaxID=3041257 RepID=UPI0028108DE4|nr:DUF1080 domain-containing protein [Pelagicoccus sp. SDUM812005]MDQ8180233.1 DUF1080 domain-containing protein [Pelagicoccus sp. SDUM812005]
MKYLLKFCLVGVVSALSLQSSLSAQNWVSLFDGKSFEGWRINERPESWAIEDGALVTRGERSHIFYDGEVANHDFRNFVFEAEVMTSPGSNSGIYVHTRFQDEGWPAAGYECQVINSNPAGPAKYVERKMTGSIYAVRNVWKAPASDNVWFKYRIHVSGKTIRTYIDGRLICEYTEPENAWRPDDKKQRLLSSGTFALQAHDPGSVVRFRNIRVKLLPDDAKSSGMAEKDREFDRLLTQFANSNHPLIDIGISTPSLDYAAEQASESRMLGVSVIDADLSRGPASLLVVNDRESAPDVEALKAAKARGCKIVFSSGGATKLDRSRIKARLLAMEAAELSWDDLWVPGKEL